MKHILVSKLFDYFSIGSYIKHCNYINKADDQSGFTPLTVTALHGHETIAKLLIENGADVNKADKNGATPLTMAIRYGYEAIVELLIKHGADVNKADENGTTPLIMATNCGHGAIVELLIKHGADVNKADKNGTTPLMATYRNSSLGYNKPIAELLISTILLKNVSEKKPDFIQNNKKLSDYWDDKRAIITKSNFFLKYGDGTENAKQIILNRILQTKDTATLLSLAFFSLPVSVIEKDSASTIETVSVARAEKSLRQG